MLQPQDLVENSRHYPMSIERDEPFWDKLSHQLDELTIKGDHEECRRILNSTDPKKIPRNWVVVFAEIAFRLNIPLYTLKTLQPIIYPENSLNSSAASEKEKIIYATALSSLGAIKDALEILEQIDTSKEPETLFHHASAHIYDWNYLASVPFLKKHIASKKVAPYKRLVSQVNLAAAFVNIGDWSTAYELLEEIKTTCEANSYQLLLGNCFELQAQTEIFQGRYDEALKFLDKSASYLKSQGGLYSMYTEKWTIICHCLQSRNLQQLQKLTALRAKAFDLRHWNTVRECDLFAAITMKDEELFKKVIMGTPSEHYRHRARKLYGANLIAKGYYSLYLGKSEQNQSSVPVFDPYKKMQQAEALYEKPLLLKAYEALTDDFYQPFTLGILFQKIYPNEKFNPFSSPSRVLQLLRRLSNWFEENKIPLKVEFKKSEFKLSALQDISVTVQRGAKLSSAEGKVSQLKDHFRDKSFSVANASEALGVSKATAERLLSVAFTQGKVIKIGRRRGMTYRLASHMQKKKAA